MMKRLATGLAGRAGWTAAGGLAAVGVVAILSIGAPLLLCAGGLAGALLSARVPGRHWGLVGAAVAFAALGAVSLPWRSCSSQAPTLVATPGSPEASWSCGGVHPAVWLGLAALALAAAYALRAAPVPRDAWRRAPEGVLRP